MDEYFDEAEQANQDEPRQQQETPSYTPPQPTDAFGEIENQAAYNPPIQATTTTASMDFDDQQFMPAEEDEVTKRIRVQEEALQQQLRGKAEEEYQLKLKRKEEASKKYQEFLEEKEKQKQQRKTENVQNEKQYLQDVKNSDKYKGWQKVVLNIKTKQGERAGKKDISRMREAILHKKEDQIGK